MIRAPIDNHPRPGPGGRYSIVLLLAFVLWLSPVLAGRTACAATVTLDEHKNIIVDGKPFIPLMQWLQTDNSSMDKSMALGINTFTGIFTKTTDNILAKLEKYRQLTEAHNRKIWGIVAFDKDPRITNHPNLLAYIHADEPDLQSNRTPPARIIADYQAAREFDPDRLMFLTVTGSFSKHSSLPRWMNGDDQYYYEYCKGTDVVGMDIYPISGWCRTDTFFRVADDQKTLREKYAANQKATFQWIECLKCVGEWCSYPARNNLGPTAMEIRAEVWMALVNGAKAIGYFTHAWRDDEYCGRAAHHEYQVTPEQEAVVSDTNRQITELTPVICSPDQPALDHRVTAGGGRVDVMVKRHGGRYYIFAVNVLHEAATNNQTVQFTLPADVAAAASRATVYEENRDLAISGGTFSDTFSAEVPVHIYVVAAGPAGPETPKNTRLLQAQ